MKTRRLLHAAALTAALLAPWLVMPPGPLGSPAEASSVIETSLEELTAISDAVVVVEASRSVSFPRKGLIPIYTRVTLQVLEYWKGSGPSTIDVVQAGGTWDGRTVVAHGVPHFPSNQTMVVFLFKHKPPFDGFGVRALEQGAFYVLRGKDGRLWAARNGSVELVKQGTVAGGASTTTTAVPNALPLETLKARVDAALAAAAAPTTTK